MKKDKIYYLEGLRGIASLIVVFHHYALAFYPATVWGFTTKTHLNFERLIYQTPLNLFINGTFSVAVFFILSGYVLSHKYFTKPNIAVVQSLAVRRYFRLMIPVFGSVFIAYLLMVFHLMYNLKIAPLTFSVWLKTYNIFLPNFFSMLYQGLIGAFISPDESYYNNVLWTMYYEFLGSFLVFSFLGIFGKYKRRNLIYSILIFIYWKTLFLSFILGVLLCDLVTRTKRSSKNGLKWFWLFLLLIGLFLGSFPIGAIQGTIYSIFDFPFLNGFDYSFYHIIAAFFILLSVIKLKTIRNFLTRKPLIYLGKISFSLYLIHLLILYSFSSFLFYILLPHISYDKSFLITFLISLPVIFIGAIIFTKYVDANGIKLSHYFEHKMTNSNFSLTKFYKKTIRSLHYKRKLKRIKSYLTQMKYG